MSSSVVMLEDMEKDRTIEARFEKYFSGTELPPLDLTEAKREVSARSRRRERRFIGGIASVAAVAASIVIGFVLLLRGLLPSTGNEVIDGSDGNGMPELNAPIEYTLSETTSSPASFTELNGKYAVMDVLAPFSLSSNASTQYTLYYSGEREVLLRADVSYSYELTYFRATLWCDLTEGEYNAEDFEEYRALVPEGRSYGFETKYMDGEYVSRGCMVRGDTEYMIDMMSPSAESLSLLVSMLQK